MRIAPYALCWYVPVADEVLSTEESDDEIAAYSKIHHLCVDLKSTMGLQR